MGEEESAGCRKDSQPHVRGGERGLQEGQEAACERKRARAAGRTGSRM